MRGWGWNDSLTSSRHCCNQIFFLFLSLSRTVYCCKLRLFSLQLQVNKQRDRDGEKELFRERERGRGRNRERKVQKERERRHGSWLFINRHQTWNFSPLLSLLFSLHLSFILILFFPSSFSKKNVKERFEERKKYFFILITFQVLFNWRKLLKLLLKRCYNSCPWFISSQVILFLLLLSFLSLLPQIFFWKNTLKERERERAPNKLQGKGKGGRIILLETISFLTIPSLPHLSHSFSFIFLLHFS